MKKVILFIVLALLKITTYSQSYDVLNYNFNNTPTYGVKIKTNFPYISNSQMPTVHIQGYNFGTQSTISLDIVWYIYDGEFHSYSASSSGDYVPKILLSNENGKVVIFIDDKPYYQRFKVSVFSQGLIETESWFTGWAIADEALNGTNTVELSYSNKFGNVSINGNVGIGTTSPLGNLHVVGTNKTFVSDNYNAYINTSDIQAIDKGGSLSLGGRYAGATSTAFASISGRKENGTNGDYAGYLSLGVRAAGSGSPTEALHIASTGNIGIGNSNPNANAKLDVNGNIYSNGKVYIGIPDANTITQIAPYALAVNGTAVFTKAKVSLYGSWPDYVFHKDYKLPTLSEIERFIKHNGHLPEVPTAEEVEKNGIDLGDNQVLLLKKIEELTLIVIEQNKRAMEQNKRIEKLEEKSRKTHANDKK